MNPGSASLETVERRVPHPWLAAWGVPARALHEELVLEPTGAYLHVPFCHHRCAYCNFTLVANRSDLVEPYLDALEKELGVLGTPRRVSTIFIGGGTPTMLDMASTERLLKAIRQWLPLSEQGEWSIEANPCDLTAEKLKLLTDYGINRVSIGGQSFDAGKLRRLDRDHSPAQLIEAVLRTSESIPNVSLDLIFAAPEETLAEWDREIDMVATLPLTHLSTYGLTYEKGARLWSLQNRGEVRCVSEELELAMYQRTIERLKDAGWEHYEVSNFAKPGYRCRHNEVYWTDQRWWAFGPGAARFVGRCRSVNHRSTTTYIKKVRQGECPMAELDCLSDDEIAVDRIVFGLRRLEGISWTSAVSNVSSITRQRVESIRNKQVESGWLALDGDRLKLTEAGLMISDGLWPEYLKLFTE